jgi:hypothetical protein
MSIYVALRHVHVTSRFSIHQLASFKEMESEFSRERVSQFIVRMSIDEQQQYDHAWSSFE